jgi:hypothetical protein
MRRALDLHPDLVRYEKMRGIPDSCYHYKAIKLGLRHQE